MFSIIEKKKKELDYTTLLQFKMYWTYFLV